MIESEPTTNHHELRREPPQKTSTTTTTKPLRKPSQTTTKTQQTNTTMNANDGETDGRVMRTTQANHHTTNNWIYITTDISYIRSENDKRK